MIHEAIGILIKSNDYGCYPGRVPQGAQLPYINHFQVSKNFNNSKDSATTKSVRYQVSIFAKTKEETVRFGDTITLLLDYFGGHVAGHNIEQIRAMDENDLYEDDADVYHRVLDFEIRYK